MTDTRAAQLPVSYGSVYMSLILRVVSRREHLRLHERMIATDFPGISLGAALDST